MHANTHTHTMKVCGPSLIDQNNVAAVTFSLGRNYLPRLCLSLSQLYVHVGLPVFLMCLSFLPFGPAALLETETINAGYLYCDWVLGFSSAHTCKEQLFLNVFNTILVIAFWGQRKLWQATTSPMNSNCEFYLFIGQYEIVSMHN